MLKHLQNKKTQKKLWIVLAVLILPAFLFWGMGTIVQSQRDERYAGKIGKKKIPFPQYRRALLAARNQALLLWGDEFFKLEKQIDLERQAWERMILLEEAARRRIRVKDEEVAELIQGYPFFQKNEKFDMEIYERLLKFMFHTPARVFEEQIRENIKIYNLYEQVTSKVKLSEEEIKNEYRKEVEEAQVEYLRALSDNFAAKVQVEEEEIEEYFKDNAGEFKRPPAFNLQYIRLDYPEDAEDSRIKAIDNKAEAVYSKLRREKDLLNFAKQNSLEAQETGFFSLNDPIPGIGWSAEIVGLIANLKPSQLAQPIHTPKGWYFIKLKEVKDSYIPQLHQVKEQVRDKLIESKSRNIAKEKIEAALEKVREIYKTNPEIDPASIGFAKLANEFGLETGQTDFFKRASYIPDIGISDRFFDIVSSLKIGQISVILKTQHGFYLVRLTDYKPMDEEEYLKEKEGFAQKLTTLNKERAFTQFLQRLTKESGLEVR